MAVKPEAIKARVGNPFQVRERIDRAAREGFGTLTEDDLFLAQWYGLYTHRHQRDYFMLRLKIPGGVMSADQVKVVGKLAQERARNFADLTTRQGLQLHWVHLKEAPGILRALEAAGISTLGACGDAMRNVVGCPLAGVDGDELFDATPVVREVSDHFLGETQFANLPHKYKVSIGACRQQCWQPEIHCVSFVGIERRREGRTETGFDVRAGGGLSTDWSFGRRLGIFVSPERVLPVLRAVTEVYRDAADYRTCRARARLKFLVRDWGPERLKAEVQRRIDFPLEDPGPVEDPADGYRDHVGVHEQKQPGLFYVGVPVPTGRVTGPQLSKVGDLAGRYGDGQVRLTVRQNLLLTGIPQERVAQVLEGLEGVGLHVRASAVVRGVVTCTGFEFCKLALTETKARSRTIAEYLEKRVRLEEPLRIHITGCPNTCAQSPIAHIGLQGSKVKVDGQLRDAYDVAVGGELGRDRAFNRFVAGKIPAEEVQYRLERLLSEYQRSRQEGEHFNAFCRRIGDEAVARLLAGEPPEQNESSHR